VIILLPEDTRRIRSPWMKMDRYSYSQHLDCPSRIVLCRSLFVFRLPGEPPPVLCFWLTKEAKQKATRHQRRSMYRSLVKMTDRHNLIFLTISHLWHLYRFPHHPPDPPHRDDRPIPRKGRPLISPIGMNLILLAAGPGFARISFYTGFTKKGFFMKFNVFNEITFLSKLKMMSKL